MYITDDPLRDADRYDAECIEMYRNAPKCIVCGDTDAPHMMGEDRYCQEHILSVCYAPTDGCAPECVVCGDEALWLLYGERYCRSCLLAECYAGIPEEWR